MTTPNRTELYDQLHAEVSAEFDSKHDSDWPDTPYKPDTLRIHRETLTRMAEIEAE